MLKRPERFKSRDFKPNFVAKSVLDIDFKYLSKHGIKAVLIDLDGTVVPRGAYEVHPEIQQALRKQPLKVYIATNRPKSRSLKDLKEHLNANGVIHPLGIWGKPFPRYYAQAASDHGLDPAQLVMIGDRYIQDIYGANKAGLQTIVVQKIGKATNPIDFVLSWLEKLHTRRLVHSYESLDT